MAEKFNLQKLRRERMARGVTQEQMANALSLTKSSYHQKEAGVTKISIEEFATILDVLFIPESRCMSFFETV